MRSALQKPCTRLARPLLRGTWLAALALVLVVHPAAGAGEGTSRGLAGLLRELLCGCAECAGEERARAQAEPSCCGHAAEGPAPLGAGCEQGGACTCSHPDEVPLPDPGPLASTTAGSADVDPVSQLDAGHAAAERVPHQVSGGVMLPVATALAPPVRPEPAAGGARRHASRPVDAPDAGARLALLSTLLL